MNVERKALAPLHEEITLTIEKTDYEEQLNQELRKYRQSASLKGFRKGKTPMSVVKRMFGKSILADLLQNQIQEKINLFLKENELSILGQPIPTDSQLDTELAVTELKDYTYQFEIGLSPAIDLQGLTKDNTFPKYVIQVADDKIQDEIDRMRRQLGSFEEIEDGAIESEDLIDFEGKELTEEGGEVKAKGFETYFTISMERLANQTLRDELLSKQKGDTLKVDLTNLEENTDQKFINKYYLNLDDDEELDIGNHFEVKIAKVRRRQLAEMNEEFFQKAFGEDSKTEEDARQKIVEAYQDSYQKQADVLLFRELQEHLMEVNTFELPEQFLKTWLRATNENMNEAQLEKEFDPFLKGLRWNLIRDHLIQKFSIRVETEEIQDEFRKKIMGYFQGQMPNMDNAGFIEDMVQRMMQNREEVEKVYEDILFDKLYEEMEMSISVDPNPITLEDFGKIVEEKNKALQGTSEEEE